MLERFNKIKEEHQVRKTTYATQEGKIATYYEQLGELGFTDIEDAKNDLIKTGRKVASLAKKIDTALVDLEEEFDI